METRTSKPVHILSNFDPHVPRTFGEPSGAAGARWKRWCRRRHGTASNLVGRGKRGLLSRFKPRQKTGILRKVARRLVGSLQLVFGRVSGLVKALFKEARREFVI